MQLEPNMMAFANKPFALSRGPRARVSKGLFLVLVLLAQACSPVSRVHVRPDYQTVDRTKTLRLGVVVAPLPGNDHKIGEMWALIARRYANQHRDFIVKEHRAATVEGDVRAEPIFADLCGNGLEGVMHLSPAAKSVGSGWELRVQARMYRCRDKEVVWEADAGGSWDSFDGNLKAATDSYVEELGEEIRPAFAAVYHLLRGTLDTLPRPHLATDDDVMEKIELGE